MAERIVAEPGSKTYGVISVLTQAYYQGEILFTVEKDAFLPPPKVKSAVIRLTRLDSQELGCDYGDFRKVVKQAFSMRRKMLRNTMKTFIKGDPLLDDEFFNQRPEQLSVRDFVSLTLQIVERVKKNDQENS
jgi:16S rRNA (adenine1518-N6/adenine1519-N6)-dimethyltransferase